MPRLTPEAWKKKSGKQPGVLEKGWDPAGIWGLETLWGQP